MTIEFLNFCLVHFQKLIAKRNSKIFFFPIGSRAAAINLEARSILADNLIRRCAVVRGIKVNIDIINKAINDGLSGLLILIPKELSSISEENLQVSCFKEDFKQLKCQIKIKFQHIYQTPDYLIFSNNAIILPQARTVSISATLSLN